MAQKRRRKNKIRKKKEIGVHKNKRHNLKTVNQVEKFGHSIQMR